MSDGIYSLSWLAPVATFFTLPPPLFGAIPQIWIGTGLFRKLFSPNVERVRMQMGEREAEEEDEVAKWQRWGAWSVVTQL